MKRRIIALALALLLLLLSVPAAAARFRDVSGGWAAAYVERAAQAGWIYGVGNGLYKPDDPYTCAQMLAMLGRAFYRDEITAAGAGERWYAPYERIAGRHGLLSWVWVSTAGLDFALNRWSMAQILCNLLDDFGEAGGLTAAERAAVHAIPDWSAVPAEAQAAVELCYAKKILLGVNPAGAFGGGQTMTCAQAAAVICRLWDYLQQRLAVQAQQEKLTVDGREYALGMTERALTALAGAPEEKLASVSGWTWYVYGTAAYTGLLLAGVQDGAVAALCASGTGFVYQGCRMGDRGAAVTAAGRLTVRLDTDDNDGGALHTVELIAPGAGTEVFTAAALAGESRVNFHLTNAFRVWHGLQPLRWSDPAAAAARLHSQDMGDRGYFSHDDPDGRSPYDRMEAQGIRWSSAGENIVAGRFSGAEAHAAWVNSAGHRENLLSDYAEMGVGGGYRADSDYRVYYTQDFWS